MGQVSPVGAVYGYELSEKIANVKSVQKQIISGLASNSKVVTLPAVVAGDTILDQLRKTNTAIQACLVANSIPFTAPTFGKAARQIGGGAANTANFTEAIPAVIPSVAASLIMKSAVPANLLTITAKNVGEQGNTFTVTIATGTNSGKKVTITSVIAGAEVFDDKANVAAIVAAINNATTGSKVVTATLILEGTLANKAATNLAGGVDGSDAKVALNDGAIDAAQAYTDAFFAAVRAYGYIY